uniref:Uncharacterized protein n=1 Tax=Parascaris equorum TaxID=6256 RepID=A0A914RKU7_PAREQ
MTNTIKLRNLSSSVDNGGGLSELQLELSRAISVLPIAARDRLHRVVTGWNKGF